MPIKPIVLQRRHAELGRIRLGHKVGGNGRPAKLGTFRFTSPSQGYIRDLAGLYGGDPQPWDNGGKDEWEVFTTASTIPVIAVKGGLSQWLETWSGGGCIHRCDGETNMLTGEPCEQDTTTIRVRTDDGMVEVSAHDAAKPTTRLSVMLPELDAIGVWRLESHGWNAAAELPTVAELAQFVGDLVPAELHLVERRAVKDGKTSRFVVPVLDLRIGAHRLREIAQAVAGGVELEAAATVRAIEAPATTGPRPDFDDWVDKVADATTLDELAQIWRDMVAARLIGEHAADTPEARAFIERWKAAARDLKDAEQPAAAVPDEDGVVDAEIVQDDDPDAVWQEVVLAAGQRGMNTADLEDDFAARMGGITAADATAGEMRHYLGLLNQEPAA